MPAVRIEVHVGNIGTLYQVPTVDQDGAPLDPTDAIVKEIWFGLPQGTLRKAATVVGSGSPSDAWMLTYRVVADDGIGSPPGQFHQATGRLQLQGHLEWADGTRITSPIYQVADNGVELRVHKNLLRLTDANEFE